MHLNLRAGDRVLIALILLAIAGGIIWFTAQGQRPTNASAGEGLVVVAQSKDGFYRADPISSDISYDIKTPATGRGADADGGSNTIRISNGQVDVEQANCSNQVCVEHDPIAAPGEQIVCLPHGIVVEVVEHEEDASELR